MFVRVELLFSRRSFSGNLKPFIEASRLTRCQNVLFSFRTYSCSTKRALCFSNYSKKKYDSEYEIQEMWNRWEKMVPCGNISATISNKTSVEEDSFCSFFRSQRKPSDAQEHLGLFLNSSASINSARRLILALTKSFTNDSKEALNIKSISLTISPMEFTEIQKMSCNGYDDLYFSETNDLQLCFFNLLSALSTAFKSRTWLFFAASLSITEIHQVDMDSKSHSGLPFINGRSFHQYNKRKISESFWCSACCGALADMIINAFSIFSFTLRNLSWDSHVQVPSENQHKQSEWRLKPVIDAIAARATSRLEISNSDESKKIMISGVRGLHLICMPSLLHSYYFLRHCLGNLCELRALTVDHTPLLVNKKCNTALTTGIEDESDNSDDCIFFSFLKALTHAVGGWDQLEQFSIADCGLHGSDVTKALWNNISRSITIEREHDTTVVMESRNSMNANIARLNISHNKWINKHDTEQDTTIFYLACCLSRIRSLLIFEARNCGFSGNTPKHMKWIAEGIFQSTELQVIRMSSNPLEDTGLKIFLQTMLLSSQKNDKPWPLKEIDFSRCSLTCRSLVPLTQLIWEWGPEQAETVKTKAVNFLKTCYGSKDGNIKLSHLQCSMYGWSRLPNLKILNLSMNDFRLKTLKEISSCSLQEKWTHSTPAEAKTNINLFSFDNNFMAGNQEYRNRGEEKVLTSYEIDRADRERTYLRYKGTENEEEKKLSPYTQTLLIDVISAKPELLWSEFGLSLTLGCPSLSTINLSDVGLEDTSLVALLSAPLILPVLEYVHFECNKIFGSPKSSDVFYFFLSHCSFVLRILDVRFTKFDDLTLSILCDGLYMSQDDTMRSGLFPQQFVRLEEFRISNTEITDIGITSLLDAFEEYSPNDSLQCIMCKGNKNISYEMKGKLKNQLRNLWIEV